MRTDLLLYATVVVALTGCTAPNASSAATPSPTSSREGSPSPSTSAIATPQPPRIVPVVLAARDIAPATQITDDMLTVAMFSTDQAPPYAFHSPCFVRGQYAVIGIHADQAITDNVISTVRTRCGYAQYRPAGADFVVDWRRHGECDGSAATPHADTSRDRRTRSHLLAGHADPECVLVCDCLHDATAGWQHHPVARRSVHGPDDHPHRTACHRR